MNSSMPGLPVCHYLPEHAQTHAHWVSDAIQSPHLLSSPSPPAFNLSQHPGSFPISRLFTSGGQSMGASVSASVLPTNTTSSSSMASPTSCCGKIYIIYTYKLHTIYVCVYNICVCVYTYICVCYVYFSCGSDGKESTCNVWDPPRFSPWVGKIPWRRKWLPTPVFLPREFQGQKSLAGCSPWGHKELGMTEQFHFLSFLYIT